MESSDQFALFSTFSVNKSGLEFLFPNFWPALQVFDFIRRQSELFRYAIHFMGLSCKPLLHRELQQAFSF